jgi:hypothetical protein
MSKKNWEHVAENTSRLEVKGGHLYRVDDQLAFVPSAIGRSLDTLADAVDELRTLFNDVTVALSHSFGYGGRAIRISNIGD